MAGIEKFAHAVRAGASIARKSWDGETVVTQAEPGGAILCYQVTEKGTKSVGDGLTFLDMFATDWDYADSPDFGRSKPKTKAEQKKEAKAAEEAAAAAADLEPEPAEGTGEVHQ